MSRKVTEPTDAVRQLAKRLHVDPRTVPALARQLDLDLYWLDVCTSPEVTTGRPASWAACLALGIDPLTGEDVA